MGREDAIEYAKKHNMIFRVAKMFVYSRDKNLWHLSHEEIFAMEHSMFSLEFVVQKRRLLPWCLFWGQIETSFGPCDSNEEYIFLLEKAMFDIELANKVRKMLETVGGVPREKLLSPSHIPFAPHLTSPLKL